MSTTNNIGVGVVPSSLASNTLTAVTGTAENFAGVFDTITLTGGTLTGFTPYAVVYTQVGGDGNHHVYTANISNSGVAPTPHQVSNLSIPVTSSAFDSRCIYRNYQNLTIPSSAFMIVEVPTGSQVCHTGAAGNTFWLIHLTDSASTAPTALPATVSTEIISATYTSAGVLTGLVLVDNTAKLVFYPASGSGTVISPTETVIASSIVATDGSVQILSDRAAHALAGGTLVFVSVTNGAGKQVIYRIDSTGSGSPVYTAAGNINGVSSLDATVRDNTNAYFYDAVGSPTVTAVTFVKVPIAGGPGTALYTDNAPGTNTIYQLIDSDGSRLIYQKRTPGTSTSLLTLTTGGANTPATLVSSTTAFGFIAFLDYGSDHLFVNTVAADFSVAGTVYTPSSTTPIAGQGGAHTYFQGFNSLFSFGAAGVATLFEYTNVTEMYPSLGLASLYTMNAASFARVQVTQGGSNYVVPTGNFPFFLPTSLIVGAGAGNDTTTKASTGLVIDVSKSQMITINAPGSGVTPD